MKSQFMITGQLLNKLDACPVCIDKFSSRWPEGVKPSLAALREAVKLGLDGRVILFLAFNKVPGLRLRDAQRDLIVLRKLQKQSPDKYPAAYAKWLWPLFKKALPTLEQKVALLDTVLV